LGCRRFESCANHALVRQTYGLRGGCRVRRPAGGAHMGRGRQRATASRSTRIPVPPKRPRLRSVGLGPRPGPRPWCGRRAESAGPQAALHARGVAAGSPSRRPFIERWCPLMVLRRFKVRAHERGLLFRDREFAAVLRPGRHAMWDPFWKVAVDLVSVRDAWLVHKDLDVIVRSGALGDEAVVVDLKDHERAVVFVDGRVEAVLKPGLYALWTVFHDVKVETFDARAVRLDHANLAAIVQAKGATALLETTTVEAG